ncbi:MAG: O-antigen ligase family protein, partial [Planctomycetia bacterium]
LAVVAFATLSSLSRGGTLALAAAAAVCIALLLRARAIQPLAALGIAAAAGGVFLALQIHGMDRVENRLDTLFDGHHQETGFGRLEVWRAATRAIADFPWLGSGVGSHADISQRYMPPTDTTVFTHAENSYLNLGVETGGVGLGLAVLAIVAAIVACLIVFRGGDQRQRGIAAAIAAALAAGIVHAGTDFIWYVPAISTLLAVVAACGMALASRHGGWAPSMSLSLGRPAVAAVSCGACALLVASGVRHLAAATAEPAWEASIREARLLARDANDWLQSKVPDPDAEQPARILATLDARIAALETVTALRPDHPRAWGALAVARLERFGLARRLAGSGIGLADLRQVATEGGFATPEDMRAWARNTLGPEYDQLEQAAAAAGRAVTVAPLDGEAWCALGSIAFLTCADPALRTRCIDQALLVRPKNSLVLFEAATQAALDGDEPRAIDLWRTSFAVSSGQRTRILSILLPLVPATEAAAMLAPDLAGLRAIDAMWSRRSTADEM